MKEGLPQDPMMRQLVQMARGKMLSRRATLLGLGGTAAVMSWPLVPLTPRELLLRQRTFPTAKKFWFGTTGRSTWTVRMTLLTQP